LNSTVRQWVRFSWSFAIYNKNTVKPAEGFFEKIQNMRLVAVGKNFLNRSPEDVIL